MGQLTAIFAKCRFLFAFFLYDDIDRSFTVPVAQLDRATAF
tara:strand:+ start:437 stop:559 length:123 start_codon:yes stop_codon:yes gene_type:complete